MKRNLQRMAGAVALALAAMSGGALAGHDGAGVSINGQTLSPGQVRALESRLGTAIVPGNYLLDPGSGCWANLSTGQRGCLGAASGSYGSRYGRGEG